jgi:hypothetical protein
LSMNAAGIAREVQRRKLSLLRELDCVGPKPLSFRR